MDKQLQVLAPVLEALEDGAYIVRDDYTIEFVNHAMVQDFGEGTGKKCFEVISQRDDICPWCKANEIFEGILSPVTLSVIMKSKNRFDYLTGFV